VAFVIDPAALAPSLRLDPAGYWSAPGADAVSYPAEGNDFCFAVEETSFWFAHRNRAIAEAVRILPPGGGPLLDVGAGNGFVAAALQRAGYDVIAIEPNEAGAANALRRGVNPVVRGTLQSAGFREGSAGAIGLFDVVEHIEGDRDFMAAIRRYLRPDGRVYLTVPAFGALWSDEDEHAGHFRRYSLASLRALLGGAGLEVEYATYFFSPLPLPIFLLRTLPSKLLKRSAEPQHRTGGKRTQVLMERLLRFELARIRRRAVIPFGSSCLAVGRVC
jgi:SAM-dependent methyltransferase